jgi:hypothetical protein
MKVFGQGESLLERVYLYLHLRAPPTYPLLTILRVFSRKKIMIRTILPVGNSWAPAASAIATVAEMVEAELLYFVIERKTGGIPIMIEALQGLRSDLTLDLVSVWDLM